MSDKPKKPAPNRYLAPEDRAAIARAGAQARWAKADPEREKLPQAICGGDSPLILGDVAIPAYVLEDERRVLQLGGFTDALGLARGGSMIPGMNRLELFVTRAKLRQHVQDDLFERIRTPIIFLTPEKKKAYGYEARVLVEVAEAVVAAATTGALQQQQLRIAQQCARLLRGLSRVGIAAMVDEATGYQEIRRKDGLRQILEAFIAKELLPWTKMFPDDYYEQIYRLHGWKGDPSMRRHPQYLGKLTTKLVYDKLPPGVRQELERLNPVEEGTGRRKFKHHRLLSRDLGHPVLSAHLTQIIALMRVSRSMGEFKMLFRRLFPDRAELAQGTLNLPSPLET